MENILSNLIVALRLGELMMVEELTWQAVGTYAVFFGLGKLFKSTLNNRLHRKLACVIDKSSRGTKLKRAFEELP